MGLVINRVLGTGPLDKLLEGLGAEAERRNGARDPGALRRPGRAGAAFVLHSPDYHDADTVVLSDIAALTRSPTFCEDIAAGKGPKRSLFALGYAGWGPDQLEGELAAGAWVVVEPDEDLLFDEQSETKWQRALGSPRRRSLGYDPRRSRV